MYKRILVPFDASEGSGTALETAACLLRPRGGAIRLVHYFDEMAFPDAFWYGLPVIESAREAGAAMLEAAVKRAESLGAHAESQLLLGGRKRLGQCISDEARSWGADLVVLGSHGRKGIGRVLLGSGAEQIIRETAVPALVVRGAAAPLPRRILVAVDGSEPSRRALTEALRLARDGGASMRLVLCIDDFAYLGAIQYAGLFTEEIRAEAASTMALDSDIAKAAGVKAETCIVTAGAGLGAAVSQQAREWNADLVVVGTHGRRGIRRAVLGSGAEQIIRESSQSVLVVPAHGTTAD